MGDAPGIGTSNGEDGRPVLDIVIGVAFLLLAGLLNGSWNAAFSPALGLAVRKEEAERRSTERGVELDGMAISPSRGRRKESKERQTSDGGGKVDDSVVEAETPPDLEHHLSWVLFQVYAAIINFPICLCWAGGAERVMWVVKGSSVLDLILVVLFSFLGGVGSVGFGVACRVAGVGLGTNLTLGVIMILGAFLPLLTEKVLLTASGGVVLVGLGVCSVGLMFSMQSLRTRDKDETELEGTALTEKRTTATALDENELLSSCDLASTQKTQASILSERMRLDVQQAIVPPTEGSESSQDVDVEAAVDREDKGEEKSADAIAGKANSPVAVASTTGAVREEHSTLRKVAVCVIAGSFASQVQFAFVFGKDLIDRASRNDEGPGATPSGGAAAIVWLFVVPLGAVISILYGLYCSPPHIPYSTVWRCPWYRHLLILSTTTVPWVAHIHLYGLATTFLPDSLGAAIAWPMLMMITVSVGILWSVRLGEWKHASLLARRQLNKGLAVVLCGIMILASSAVV